MDTLLRAGRLYAKYALKPLLYSYPPVGLQPERLLLWLQTLAEIRDVDGAVLEVGCNLGGTAAVSTKLLKRLGADKDYVCIDTFSGFVPEQFDADIALGNVAAKSKMFSANSQALARWVLDRHGGSDVRLIQADICQLDVRQLPPRIAACLVDVDLAEPVKVALQKIYPLLAPTGRILVDDCPQDYEWQARKGYEDFVLRHGLHPDYQYGMGRVIKPA